ncbi:hypothetical protein [Nostoc sp.]|uniref:hypothetical protein n=1 Tax=Nostoc sp. TaxID=1180 RepID=UPI002FFC011F
MGSRKREILTIVFLVEESNAEAIANFSNVLILYSQLHKVDLKKPMYSPSA